LPAAVGEGADPGCGGEAIELVEGAAGALGAHFVVDAFEGRLDEMRIYGRALDPQEIEALAAVRGRDEE
ncbi:MAG: hypothetical protein AAFY88_24350, partial [Acidobacteriota bacterium]